MNRDELKAAIDAHAEWVETGEGARADLSWADLIAANLRGAHLPYADLSYANLRCVNLSGADLSGAHLTGADLKWSTLRGADLTGADLTGADLTGADLTGASIAGADLTGAAGATLALARTEILPREGEVIGWKKCCNAVVKVRVPPGVPRSNATGRKCRAARVEVLEVWGVDGKPRHAAAALFSYDVIYRAGETVVAHDWESDRLVECAGGIHFFLTREEAEDYTL